MRLEANMRTAVMNLAKGKRTQASNRIIRMEEATRADSLTVFFPSIPNPMPTPRMVAADDTAPGKYSTSYCMTRRVLPTTTIFD